MNKGTKIKAHFKQLEIISDATVSDFKKALVHISFYEVRKEDNDGNSRYVFLGMYAFKGVLANLVSQYVTGNGKQLQQYLGNIFSNEQLSKIFDFLDLATIITCAESIDYKQQKHIFSLAYLGFIFQHCSQAFQEKTAYEFFIKPNDHLLPKSFVVNVIHQLKHKTLEVFQENTIFRHSQEKNLEDIVIFKTTICLSSGKILAEHCSKSKLYAKKQAVKLALIATLKHEEASLLQNRSFLKNREQAALEKKVAIASEKQTRIAEYLEKKKTKKAKKNEIAEQKRKIAIAQAKQRQQNKQAIKQEKLHKKELQENQKNISSAKKQFLDDKAK